MVGHMFDNEERSLIMTSGKGQVVYPVIFDTFYVEKQGYLKLYCLPGALRYQNDTYNVVSSPEDIKDDETDNDEIDNDEIMDDEATYPNLPSFPAVSKPLNLLKDLILSWKSSNDDSAEIYNVDNDDDENLPLGYETHCATFPSIAAQRLSAPRSHLTLLVLVACYTSIFVLLLISGIISSGDGKNKLRAKVDAEFIAW
ncbi:hypothetical protein VE01_02265 [Pseudogymnoascus verrucosus]|uniref:Uncharacterized protein n=1 Tax=Pseudogymnoascus verrucosus TaxID=342668 RepID=A0A1B8GTI7_9PEZI|nr:uncharacterized protein VE01_02265 [Pseudogymnoascus verrucosus]OBT99141.1 hypothetical protein VE01_02265 [Pseudogymnoascus verrucosus]